MTAISGKFLHFLTCNLPVLGPSLRTVNWIASSPQIHTMADPPLPPSPPKLLPPLNSTLPKLLFRLPPAPSMPTFLLPPVLPKLLFLPPPMLPSAPPLPPLPFPLAPGLVELLSTAHRGILAAPCSLPVPLPKAGGGLLLLDPDKVAKLLALLLLLLLLLVLVESDGRKGWLLRGADAAGKDK